jgi:hypothetical protein
MTTLQITLFFSSIILIVWLALTCTVRQFFLGIGLIIFNVAAVLLLANSTGQKHPISVGDDYVCQYAREPDRGNYDCGTDKEHPFWPYPHVSEQTLKLVRQTREEYNEDERKRLTRWADLEHYYERIHADPNAPAVEETSKDIVLKIILTVAGMLALGKVAIDLPDLATWIAHSKDPVVLRILALPLWLTGLLIWLIILLILLWVAAETATRVARRIGLLPYPGES